MSKFLSFQGTITKITNFSIGANDKDTGCYKLMSVENESGNLVNFVVTPNTYFVDHVMVAIGDKVTGFYDSSVPVPMIFPPQYTAVVMARRTLYQNVKVDFFNNELVSSDNMLKLNLAPCTQLILENDQAFTQNPGNRNLIAVYGVSTKSIPAQTVPYKIIVMC